MAITGGTEPRAAGNDVLQLPSRDRARGGFRVEHVLAVAAGLLFMGSLAVAQLTTPSFLTHENLLAILQQASFTGIVAVGLVFITVTGNLISLATQGMALIAGAEFTLLIIHGWSTFTAVVVVLAVAVAIGAIQGGIVVLGLNPIVTTLAAGMALSSISTEITGSKTVTVPAAGTSLGRIIVDGVPIASIIFVVLTIVASWYMKKTSVGREMQLVGSNRKAAVLAGLRPGLVTVVAFVVFSICASVVGVLQTSQFASFSSTQFSNIIFDAIAAVLVGGAAVTGGRGSPWATALAASLISAIDNFLITRGVSTGVQQAIQGLIVGLAIVSFWLLRRRTT